MVDVYGIKSHTIAIEAWLFPTGSGSISPEHTLSAHQASECSAASHADTRDSATMQVSPRLTVLLWPENRSEESCQIRKVAGKYREA